MAVGLAFLANGAAGLAATPTVRRVPARRVSKVRRPAKRLVPNSLVAFKEAIAKIQAPAAERVQAEAVFKKLPGAAQRTVVAVLNPTYARQVRLPAPRKAAIIQFPGGIIQLIKPTINSVYPDEGTQGNFAIVTGSFLTSDCKVYIGAHPKATTYIYGMLLFTVPAGEAFGAKQITVKNMKSGKASQSVNWKVVAPRNYRGRHGWSFPNFGTPSISWAVYRNYFGADEVEYANGSHRPAAQAWYDSKYYKIGAGGDCYGMSMRSVRARRQDWRGNYSGWWPGHKQPTVWDYAKVDPQIVDSIRWDQGGQLCAQSAALINDRYNNQSHDQAYAFISAALSTGTSFKQPMLGMWSGFGGHAVVAYKIKTEGANKRIYLYDNNKPYRETVFDDANSIATVNGGNFSYGGYNKMIAFRFDEMSFANPQLPAAAAGSMSGLSAGLTVITCDDPQAVKNIVDEKGRSFFGRGAQRIPNSSRFIPMTGGRVPADFPAIFLFNASKGKTLTVDLQSNREAKIRSFFPGRVNTLVAKAGRVRFSKLNDAAHTMDIINPDSMKPKSLEMISVLPGRNERLFQLAPKSALGKDTLQFGIEPQTKNGVFIRNGNAVAPTFDLKIQNFTPQGVQQKNFLKLQVPKAQSATFKVGNMGALGSQKLMRGLQKPSIRKIRPIKR